MRFSEKLTALIEAGGTNQSRLARQTGISQSAISAMTRGDRRPYMDQALLLARALGVPLDFLADDDQDALVPALTDAEVRLLEMARRIGVEAAIDRVLNVPPQAPPPGAWAQNPPSPPPPPAPRRRKQG